MRALVICVLAAGVGVARPGSACVPCNCGDPTLTAPGVEQPYRNRIRIALEERVSSHATEDRDLSVLRSGLYAVWAPHNRILLGAMLPWVTTWYRVPGRTDLLNGLGDLEVSGRVIVWRDRRFGPQHLLSVAGGIKTPTGQRLVGGNGYYLSDDDQPSSGSWDPFADVSYSYFSRGLVAFFASASLRWPTKGPRGYERGVAVGGSAQVQLQPHARFAILLGAQALHRRPDSLANGADSPSTGGTVLGVTPGFLIAPTTAMVIRVGATIPVVQALYGRQHEGPQGLAAMSYDFN